MKKTFIASLLLISLLLPGCVALLLGAGAGAVGKVVYDRRSMDTIHDDLKIESTAVARFDTFTELTAKSHLVISSFNHIVLLAGQTPKPEYRAEAENIVQSIPSVRRIYNEITIAGPTANPARANDSWITTKVKSQLLSTKGLRSGLIKVITENGTVYLMGLVTRDQGILATDATRQVNGVERVVKLFEYIPN